LSSRLWLCLFLQLRIVAQRLGRVLPAALEDGGVQLPEGALLLNMLSIVPIGDHHYVILNDIMELFDLREDYCLAIVAQNLQEDRNTINLGNDKYSVMDAYVVTGDFIKPTEALAMIYGDAAACAATLPTESKFKDVQERLGITKMGREVVSTTMAPSSSFANDSLVDLWNAALIDEDGNQK
ncbi:hypothetical protein L7F22_005447, partial [Adiantum nelumboides]|nr:hypothetical protein [Adiantum nelumboides]